MEIPESKKKLFKKRKLRIKYKLGLPQIKLRKTRKLNQIKNLTKKIVLKTQPKNNSQNNFLKNPKKIIFNKKNILGLAIKLNLVKIKQRTKLKVNLKKQLKLIKILTNNNSSLVRLTKILTIHKNPQISNNI